MATQGKPEQAWKVKSDGKEYCPFSVPMTTVASCPYLVDYSQTEMPQLEGDKRADENRIDLISALNQFID